MGSSTSEQKRKEDQVLSKQVVPKSLDSSMRYAHSQPRTFLNNYVGVIGNRHLSKEVVCADASVLSSVSLGCDATIHGDVVGDVGRGLGMALGVQANLNRRDK